MKIRLLHKKTKEQRLNDGLNHDSAKQYRQARAYHNRGNACTHLEQYQQALADYDRALQLDPQLAIIHFNRGTANYKLNKYEQAIADFDRALQLDPQDSDALHWREQALQRLQGT